MNINSKINKLSLSILRKVEPDVISGMSLYIILIIILLGVDLNKDRELVTILGLEDNQISIYYSKIQSTLHRFNKLGIIITNSFFMDRSFKIKDSFLKVLGKDINVKQIDFRYNPKESANVINKIIHKGTGGRIESILSENDINNDTSVVLINTIHFEGEWKIPFNPNNNVKKRFTGLGGNRDEHYMISNEEGNYYTNADFHVYEKTYSNGACLGILMAHSGIKVQYDKVNIYSIINNFKITKVELSLPKFSSLYKVDAVDILKKIGIINLFNKVNCLSGISDNNISISKIMHQAKITVHEIGTEASAATVAIIEKSFIINDKTRIKFNVNRSFMWYIRDIKTNIIIFMGIYH